MGGVERVAVGVSSTSSNSESKDESEEVLISPSGITRYSLSCRLAFYFDVCKGSVSGNTVSSGLLWVSLWLRGEASQTGLLWRKRSCITVLWFHPCIA